jgi:hypothetical protein
MSRRGCLLRVAAVLLALAAVALALAFTTWALVPQVGAMEANCRQIRPGMTGREAEQILGRPCDCVDFVRGQRGRELLAWYDNKGLALVECEMGLVVRAEWRPRNPPVRPFTRFRAWLGW